MNNNFEFLDELREHVRTKVSEKRYAHILRVEEEVAQIGAILLPEKIKELRIAAIFHDVTKDIYLKEQLQLCKKFDIILDKCAEEATLHALTGAYYAREVYPSYVTDEIFDAISAHTTGSSCMTTFDKILFVADYIEAGRKYERCRAVREKFWSFDWSAADDERIRHLDNICIEILDNTLTYLIENKKVIDKETLAARNALVGKML